VFFRGVDSEQSDEELLQRYLLDQRQDRLSTLYLRYTTMVYGVCLKYLNDRSEAQDAVMQLYEKLTEEVLKHEITNFRGWLYVTARNYCLMQLRSRKIRNTEEISLALMENGVSEHLEDDVRLEEQDERLENCMKQLTESQHTCVTLFYLKEMCYRDISAATGFDHNQVKSHIQNGKRNLKLCMEKNE